METSEQVQAHSTIGLASMAFNHEAKLMVLMCLDKQEDPLSRYRLHKEIINFGPTDNLWTPSYTSWGQYCDHSLIPAGFVERQPAPSRHANTTGYKLTSLGQQLAVPAAGFFLDWSLRHMDLSVQDLLGNTNSSGELRSGETRVRILQEACTNPASNELSVRTSFSHGVNTAWDSSEYKKERTRISQNIAALALVGVVKLETIQHNDDRTLLVTDARPPEGLSYHPDLKIAAALYEVIADADKVRDESAPFLLGFDETVIKTIAKLSDKGIDADPVRVRKAVGTAYFSETIYPGITKADPARFNKGKLTRFSINEEHREAVEEFLNLLINLESNGSALFERGVKLVRSIRDNLGQRAQLMNKAFVFSPHAQRKSILKTAVELETILSDLGSASLDEITQVYRDRYRRPIQKDRLRNVLVLLQTKGLVKQSQQTNNKKPGYLLKRNIYTLIDTD